MKRFSKHQRDSASKFPHHDRDVKQDGRPIRSFDASKTCSNGQLFKGEIGDEVPPRFSSSNNHNEGLVITH